MALFFLAQRASSLSLPPVSESLILLILLRALFLMASTVELLVAELISAIPKLSISSTDCLSLSFDNLALAALAASLIA